MRKAVLFLPFFYFLITRLKNLKNFIFHSYFEWIPAVGLLFLLEDTGLVASLKEFLFGYLAFISIYEIGYLTNDQLSEKSESNPRKRLDNNLSRINLLVLILVRVGVFIGVTIYLGFDSSIIWWSFYLLLGLSFFLHNLITNNDYRLITFLNLSVFRFFAPIFIFLSLENFQLLFPVILVCYSFFRTLIYMDNKDLLSVKSRKSPLFNLSFFVITFIVMSFYSIVSMTWIPLILAGYFMVFTFSYFLKSKVFNG